MVRAGELGGALGAVDEGGEFFVALRQPADYVQGLGAVGEGPFDAQGVEVLAAIGAVGGAAPDAVGGDGPRVLDPAQLINLMDVHLGEQAAGDPEEVHEVPDLPEQLFLVGRLLAQVAHRLHAVGADELDLAQLAVAHTLDEFQAVARVAALQAGGDLKVLLLGGFPGLDEAAQAGGVGGKGFLHEDVDALLDGVFELRRGGSPNSR